MRRKNIDKYEWYMGNGEYLYGDDAYDYIRPKFHNVRRMYYNIMSLMHSYMSTGNIIEDYLTLREILSVVETDIKCLEENDGDFK